MLPPLKIFIAEQQGPVLIVTPDTVEGDFRYSDLHMEVNAIRSHMGRPGNKHLVIDLHRMDYFGSEFIGALVAMAREVRNRRNQAVVCAAAPQMYEILQGMSLFKLWPYYDTRDEALNSVGTVVAQA